MFKKLINKAELNNKVWFRKLVRALGGRLLPNFDVEEIVMTRRDASYDTNHTVMLIGEDRDEYECFTTDPYFKNGGIRWREKWTIDDEYTVTDVIYKELNTCTLICGSRIEQLAKWEKETMEFTWSKPDGMDKELFELTIDLLEEELLKHTKTSSFYTSGNNGVFNIRIHYSRVESKLVNEIKRKFDGKLYS